MKADAAQHRIIRNEIFRIARNAAVMVVMTLCMVLPHHATVLWSVGAEQAQVLFELGVFPDFSDAYLSADAVRADCAEAALRLVGSGDAAEAAAFYRVVTPDAERAPDLYADWDGSPARGSDRMDGAQGYTVLLRAMGYTEDAFGTSAEDVLAFSRALGFGFLTEVRDGTLTNGRFAMMLYESLFLRVRTDAEPDALPTAGMPVYRILGDLNSEFCTRLLQHGLYDAVPEDLAPRFPAGMYRAGSFSVLPGDAGRREWTARYRNVTQEDAQAYVGALADSGWILEGQYAFDATSDAPEATLWLYYRTGAAAPDASETPETPDAEKTPEPSEAPDAEAWQELGLAVKHYTDGTLEWALFME